MSQQETKPALVISMAALFGTGERLETNAKNMGLMHELMQQGYPVVICAGRYTDEKKLARFAHQFDGEIITFEENQFDLLQQLQDKNINITESLAVLTDQGMVNRLKATKRNPEDETPRFAQVIRAMVEYPAALTEKPHEDMCRHYKESCNEFQHIQQTVRAHFGTTRFCRR